VAKELVILGWTFPQWLKAYEYVSVGHPSGYQLEMRHRFAEAFLGNWRALQDLAEIQMCWRLRRSDAPGEVEIVLESGYRKRS
jgi:hypothetical protein